MKKGKAKPGKSGKTGPAQSSKLDLDLQKAAGRPIIDVTRNATVFYRSPAMWMPDSIVVTQRYADGQRQRTYAGFTYTSWRYRANSVFDPDPALASGTVAGYNELSQIYGRYRVVGIRYQVTFTSLDDVAYSVAVYPTTIDIGANSSASSDYAEMPRSKWKAIGVKTGNSLATIKGELLMSDIVGSAAPTTDLDYASNVGANPTKSLFLNMAALSVFGGMTNGIGATTVLDYIVLWDNRFAVAE